MVVQNTHKIPADVISKFRTQRNSEIPNANNKQLFDFNKRNSSWRKSITETDATFSNKGILNNLKNDTKADLNNRKLKAR